MERVARLVDDRLQELVPRPRGRHEASHAMEEAQLVELLRLPFRGATRIEVEAGHDRHDTSLENNRPADGCGAVAAPTRNGRGPKPGRQPGEPPTVRRGARPGVRPGVLR